MVISVAIWIMTLLVSKVPIIKRSQVGLGFGLEFEFRVMGGY